jgi:hypothetical protein
MYKWEHAFQLAISETHTTKLHACILDAEELIFTRTIELSSDSRRHDAAIERAAMEHAGEKLAQLKRTMLGWPATEVAQ